MSIGYIIDEAAKIKDLAERREKADTWARHMPDRLPWGGHNPPFFPGDTEKETILRWMVASEQDFAKLKELCGGSFPEFLQGYYEGFQKRREHTEKLLNLDWKETKRQNLCEYFPYWADFNEYIHATFDRVESDIDISKLKFLPELIAKGGCAEVYGVKQEGSKKQEYDFAVKLFYPSFMFQCELERPDVRYRTNQIAKNLKSQKDFLNQEPFVRIHAKKWRKDEEWETEWAYIMDYVNGIDVMKMLEKTPEKFKDKILTGNIILTYAKMLKMLHESQRVFVDNSLDAIIVDENSGAIKVCDADNITPVAELKDEHTPYHLYYSTYEQVLKKNPSYSSDLEAFAEMVHHLVIRKPFMGEDNKARWEEIKKHREHAEKNKRIYLKQFERRLPKQLAQIVPALIRYPRDNSITADDFISAIKSDYKV